MRTKTSSIDEIRKQTRKLIEEHVKSIRAFHENHFPQLCAKEGEVLTDIVERLRHNADFASASCDKALFNEAANEITRLREALQRISNPDNWGDDGCWLADSYPDEIAEEALNRQIDGDNETRLSRPFSGRNEG